MYKCLIRPVLFLFDPEGVHYFSFAAIRLLHRIPFMGLVFRTFFTYKVPTLEREVFGLQFPNPVGLAPDFIKDAKLYH